MAKRQTAAEKEALRAEGAKVAAVTKAASRPAFIKDAKKKEDVIETGSIVDLACRLASLKEDKARLEEELKLQNKAIDEVTRELAEAMAEKQLDLFRVPDLGTFSTGLENHPRVTDASTFFAWLRENGAEHMIKEVVHPQTLKGYINERLKEEGGTLPPGIDNYAAPKINFRRAK